MALTLRTQDIFVGAGGTTGTEQDLTGVQAGDFLVVLGRDRDAQTLSSIGDTVNGAASWTLGPNITGDAQCFSGYFINSGAGDPDTTVTFAGSSVMAFNVSVWDPDGTVTLEDFDESSQGGAGATSHPGGAGTVTLSGQGVILVGYTFNVGAAGTITAPAGFTQLTDDTSGRTRYYYKISTGESVNPTMTTGNAVTSESVVLAFRDTVGGGGGTSRSVFTTQQRRRRQ